MNTENINDLSLEEMRRLPIGDLLKLELETLHGWQRQAEAAASAAQRAQSWINGIIDLKLGAQERRQDENGKPRGERDR